MKERETKIATEIAAKSMSKEEEKEKQIPALSREPDAGFNLRWSWDHNLSQKADA